MNDDFNIPNEIMERETKAMNERAAKFMEKQKNRRAPDHVGDANEMIDPMTSEVKKHVIHVSIADVDMPCYGAYKAASALEGKAKILLNFSLCCATAKFCDESPEMVMTEVAAHELGHALEEVFGRLFSETDAQTLAECAAGVEVATAEDKDDAHGEALTSMAAFGYEQGRASVLNDPMTSVVRWVRYDGSKETLPVNGKLCLFSNEFYEYEIMKFDDGFWYFPNGDEEEAQVGDWWAYLPTPPEQTT